MHGLMPNKYSFFSYEQGMRASLGQDLSGLREQQNQINQSLGDIMDSIDNNTEEPKYETSLFHKNMQEAIFRS